MTFQDETLQIDTPENVVFGYQIAGIGSRFLACAIDTLLISALLLFVNFALAALLRVITPLVAFGRAPAWLIALFGLVSFAILWGYYIFFETLWNGQTPGKRRNGLRVIRRSGTPITAGEAVIRNLVRIIDFLPVFYGVGIVAMFIDGQSRRLGDLAAGTLVVRDREAVTLSSLYTAPVGTRAQADDEPPDGRLPVERLSAQEIEMVEDYFRRRHELANRDAIAWQMARSLCNRMGIASDTIKLYQAERFLSDVQQAHRRRSGS
jgi:uncharacterized RDD family membrane protein YckC